MQLQANAQQSAALSSRQCCVRRQKSLLLQSSRTNQHNLSLKIETPGLQGPGKQQQALKQALEQSREQLQHQLLRLQH
jgi:hypothetical protein